MFCTNADFILLAPQRKFFDSILCYCANIVCTGKAFFFLSQNFGVCGCSLTIIVLIFYKPERLFFFLPYKLLRTLTLFNAVTIKNGDLLLALLAWKLMAIFTQPSEAYNINFQLLRWTKTHCLAEETCTHKFFIYPAVRNLLLYTRYIFLLEQLQVLCIRVLWQPYCIMIRVLS